MISGNTPVVIVNGKQVPVLTGNGQVLQLAPGQSVQVRVDTKGDSLPSGLSSQMALQSLQQLMGQMKGLQLIGKAGSGQVNVTGGQFQVIISDGKGNGNGLVPAPQIKVDAPPQIKLDSATATPRDSAAPPSK